MLIFSRALDADIRYGAADADAFSMLRRCHAAAKIRQNIMSADILLSTVMRAFMTSRAPPAALCLRV